jgi:hypothetical protein
MSIDVDEFSVAYRSREMAKLYKALGSHIVPTLRVGSRVDTLAGQFELEPVYVTAAGIRWLCAAEALVAPSERDSVSLDDLTLAFEVTHEPSESGWCERGSVGFWESPVLAPEKTFRNAFS